MAVKVYGTLVKSYKYTTLNEKQVGVMNRTLEVYETPTLFKCYFWNSGILHWKSAPHKAYKEVIYKKCQGYNIPEELPVVREVINKYSAYNSFTK